MALITIKNEALAVTVNTAGATLDRILKDGTQYLWQGDPAYWKRKDNNLFPCVGRQKDGHYLLQGKAYPMNPHGFCADAPFRIAEETASSVRLVLEDSPATREIYPFSFSFEVFYELQGSTLTKRCTVTNKGTDTMYFGLGSHPGFQVPLGDEGSFEDWYLEFPEPSQPVRIEFNPKDFLVSGEKTEFPLKEGRILPLQHSLFDRDAITLENIPRTVTLKSERSARAVQVSYPDMPFLGIWHAPHTDAPYVCIEPWLSLPAHSAYLENLDTQEHLIHLPASGIYENTITFSIC